MSSTPASLRSSDLGKNFKEALGFFGYSCMKDVARKMGWHSSLVRDRCNGQTSIKVTDILEISDTLENIDPTVLFSKIIDAQDPVASFTEREIDFFIMLVEDRIRARRAVTNAASPGAYRFQVASLEKLRVVKQAYSKED